MTVKFLAPARSELTEAIDYCAGGADMHDFRMSAISRVYEATVNSKPRIGRGYNRPPLDPLLNQRTTPYPLLNQEGGLDKLQPIGYSASVWLETPQVVGSNW